MTETRAALQLLTCTAIGPALDSGSASHGTQSQRVLVEDYDVSCEGPSSIGPFRRLGFPALICYGLGIPVAAAAFLFSRRSKLDRTDVRRWLGFLYAGFRPTSYYWEVVIMLRKFLLSTIAVFLAPVGVDIQTYTAMALIVLFGALHIRMWPYARTLLNRLELGAILTAFWTLLCGTYLVSPNVGKPAKVVVTALLVMVNVAFLLWALFLLFSLGLGGGKSTDSTSDAVLDPREGGDRHHSKLSETAGPQLATAWRQGTLPGTTLQAERNRFGQRLRRLSMHDQGAASVNHGTAETQASDARLPAPAPGGALAPLAAPGTD